MLININGIDLMFFFFQGKEDFDPLAERRRPTIADREDEYRQKRRRLAISPERADPFADGLYHFQFILFYCVSSS